MSMRNRQHMQQAITTPMTGRRVYSWLPVDYWAVLKQWRRGSTRISLLIALIMSTGVALAVNKTGIASSDTLGFCAALLTAAYASDIRSLSRRSLPAEVTALRGTTNFVIQQLRATFLVVCLITLPLVLAGISSAPMGELLSGIAIYSALGMAAGFMSGSLFAPNKHDISSQFVANIVAMGVLLLLPQLPFLQHAQNAASYYLYGLVALSLLGIGFYIEYNRNTFIWRKKHEH